MALFLQNTVFSPKASYLYVTNVLMKQSFSFLAIKKTCRQNLQAFSSERGIRTLDTAGMNRML